ncbi:MAG: thioredoxin [Bacteroidota bacterium]|nr:thioredoxin [Bacteroidota bacterium]
MKSIGIIALTLTLLAPMASCQNKSADKKQVETKTVATKGIEHLTAATFKQKVFNYDKNKQWKFEGNKPCIIDFYADWCGPCRMLAPTIEQVAKEYNGKIDVYKVNVDEQQELASNFGISSIPAVLFCPSTDKPQMTTGVLSKEEMDKAIKELLKVK